VTTPAQGAPLVAPSVAFRPTRLFVICVVLTALATLATWQLGHPTVGLFFGVGLALGLINALLVRRSVASVAAEANPLKRKLALNSMTRLAILTAIGLAIAFVFKPEGLGVVFGMALFQILLVFSAVLPVAKKIRAEDAEAATAGGATTEGETTGE
jgi:hypothetical protein